MREGQLLKRGLPMLSSKDELTWDEGGQRVRGAGVKGHLKQKEKYPPAPGCEEAYWVNGKFRKAEK